MANTKDQGSEDQDLPGRNEISLLDLAIILGEEKKILFGIPALFSIAAIVYTMYLPPIFTGKTVVLPPQQQQSMGTGTLAGLGTIFGISPGAFGVKSPEAMYIGFLQSASLQDRLMKRLNLVERYGAKSPEAARDALAASVKITIEQSGLIVIETDDRDPAFAAELANAYVVELRNLLGRVAVSEAQQRRVFLEQQIASNNKKLAEAEVALRVQQEASGVVSVDALARGAIQATVELRSHIAQREVQLGTLRTYATTENADVQRLSAELAGLRGQLSKLEQGSGQSNVSRKGMEAVRAYRELKYLEAVMDALVRQYELAKVDEAREGPLLQQIDVATPPERKSKPKRTLIVLAAGFSGLVLGMLLALLRRAWRLANSNPESMGRMQALKKAWLRL